MLRIEETARERRKSREGGSIRESTELCGNDAELESLLDDPEARVIEDREEEQERLSNDVEEEPANHDVAEANDVEEEIPIAIPLDDLPLSRGEEEEAPVVTKAEPVETSESNEQVIERPLERVPTEPPINAAGDPKRRLTEDDDPNMDSMDRLRRDLEKLANKGKGSGTETRPLRKTGPEDADAGGEEDLGETEVKQEGTWYCKPPMSPELLIAIAVRNLDPHKEVSCHCFSQVLQLYCILPK